MSNDLGSENAAAAVPLSSLTRNKVEMPGRQQKRREDQEEDDNHDFSQKMQKNSDDKEKQ